MNPLERIKELGYHSIEDYHLDAFSRNIGFLSLADLAALRHKRIAIPGLGGVGGVHLIAHLRTGFCNFNISDFDTFDVVNTNRQYGAKTSNFNKPKLDSMVQEALEINPFAQINTFPEGINESNVDKFLEGVDVIIDSLDVFVIDLRILLFNKAREKGIPIVTAAPLGFGTSIIAISPKEGMSFDNYFGIKADMSEQEKFIRLIAGVAPKGLHSAYVDILSFQPHIKRVPSLGAGCFFAATAACSISTKIVLGHKGVRYAPNYFAVDPYLQKVSKGCIYGGNSNPLQIFKMKMMKKILENVALEKDQPPKIPEFNSNSNSIPYEVKEYIVQAGTQAPSGENTQPWRFVIGENHIIVKLNPEADLSFFNIQKRASLLAIGAAIENIKIASSAFGLSCNIQYQEGEPDDSLEVAKIYLKNTGAERDSLFRSIWGRCTNRKQFNRKKIESFVFEDLKRIISESQGAKLHIIDDRAQLKKLRKALTKIGIARTENPLVHKFLNNHIRPTFKDAQNNRTGFPLDNLEGGKFGNFVLTATKNWSVMNFLNKLGFAKVLSSKIEEGIENCGACILITMPSNSALDYVKGGQILERIWLKLTELGVSAQPMTTMNFFNLRRQLAGMQSFESKHHKLIEESMKEYNEIFPQVNMDTTGQIMLLRIGYSKGIKTWTLRQNVKKVIEPVSIIAETEKKLVANH